MRIRQLKPEFWSDAVIARLSDTAQLLYMGLWCEADDAGVFEWDVETIGAHLRPYKTPSQRVKQINKVAEELQAEGRLRMLAVEEDGEVVLCGHAVIPTLPHHQKMSEKKRVFTHRRRHDNRECPRLPRSSPEFPGVPGRERKGKVEGKESKGTVVRAGARQEGAPRSADVTDIVEKIAARAGGLA